MKITLLIYFVLFSMNTFGQTQIFSDSFTGTFPGSWTVGNDGGITGTKWGNNSSKSTGDGWSAFCADNGNDKASTYPDNLSTYMEQRAVSLVGFSSAALTFKYIGRTEANKDFFTVNIRSQAGSWSQVFKKSGTISSWTTQTIDLSSFCGQSGLYVQFRFDSNKKTTYEGIWLDDISLTASAGLTSAIAVTSPNGGESWEIGTTKTIAWSTNNLTGNVKIELNNNYASGAWEVLYASIPNDGSEPWIVTGSAGTAKRIRVTSVDNATISDISNNNFTMSNPPSISQIQWSGYTWSIKSGLGNPGPNNWLANSTSVWVDPAGELHLKIRKIGNIWYSSEIVAPQSLGYGEYTFELSSNIETLDKNIVLGLFTYETDTREIDIEFARWGVATNPAAQYVLQPSSASSKYNFPLNMTGNYSTHKFNWSASEIFFQSYYGHTTDYLINQWMYKGVYNPPAGKERIHLNLWLYQGKAPSNLQEAEVIIKSFTFKESQPAITVLSPNGGENWIKGSTQNITWTSTKITDNVMVEIDRNYPSGIWETLFVSTPNDGIEPLTVTGDISNLNRIRITSLGNPLLTDVSNTNFSLISADGFTPLANCVPIAGLSATKGVLTAYMITVPRGATNLNISTSGGNGDSDLHVKIGQIPTTTLWDYRSWAAGNDATIILANPVPGDYYIGLNAFAAYSGVTLTACYAVTGPDPGSDSGSSYKLISGINDVMEPDVLNIYPNPASDQVTVSFNRSIAIKQHLEIMNSLGQVLYSKRIQNEPVLNETVDVRYFAKGLYYVRLITGDGTTVSKFLKD